MELGGTEEKMVNLSNIRQNGFEGNPRNEERNFIMKSQVNPPGNLYAHNNIASKYKKQKSTDQKEYKINSLLLFLLLDTNQEGRDACLMRCQSHRTSWRNAKSRPAPSPRLIACFHSPSQQPWALLGCGAPTPQMGTLPAEDAEQSR